LITKLLAICIDDDAQTFITNDFEDFKIVWQFLMEGEKVEL
jgi:hypothetical protein